jgi:hypothetical protein
MARSRLVMDLHSIRKTMSALNPSPTEPPTEPSAESEAALPWLTLLTLVSAFALSQAFRTVTAMMATGLQQEFGLHEGLAATQQRPETLVSALRGFGVIFLLPQTWGILALAGVNYASFLTLRGLWLGPLLMHRHAMTLLQTGNVALLVSLISLFTPALFGHFDPGPARRRRWIVWAVTLMATVAGVMAFVPSAWVGVGGMVALAVLSGAGVLQYANVRASYGVEFAGRAMSVFTMSMFLGVAIVQSLSGVAASWSTALGGDPYAGVLLCIAVLLMLGAMVFRFLPAAPVR